MRSDLAELALVLMTLVGAAAAEELLPHIMGIGVPILLGAALHFALTRPLPVAIMFACVAGLCEDALSGLPMASSLVFFALMPPLSKSLPHFTAFVAFPLCQVWLWPWVGYGTTSLFARFLIAIPLGLVGVILTSRALAWIERRAALDEG